MREGLIRPGYWISLLYYGVNLIFLMFTYILAFIVEKLFRLCIARPSGGA